MSDSARLLLRGLQLCNKAFNVAPKVARGLVHGVVLGIGTDGVLDALDEAYYASTEKYVDPGYNSQGLWAWEQAALDAHFDRGSRIMVSAAGGGREVFALLRQGFDAYGFECNAELATFADQLLGTHGHNGRILHAPRDGWPSVSTEPSDGLVIGWGSYMLMRGRPCRIAFLQEAFRRLRPGAPVLVSFFHREDGDLYFRVVASVGTLLRRLRGAGLVEVGDALVPNFAHFFTEEELRGELQESGFQMITCEAGGYGRAVAQRSFTDVDGVVETGGASE